MFKWKWCLQEFQRVGGRGRRRDELWGIWGRGDVGGCGLGEGNVTTTTLALTFKVFAPDISFTTKAPIGILSRARDRVDSSGRIICMGGCSTTGQSIGFGSG